MHKIPPGPPFERGEIRKSRLLAGLILKGIFSLIDVPFKKKFPHSYPLDGIEFLEVNPI